ncbi:MAG: porin [Verrucomicrobia bacterium]|nr:MAG: porin [Verrucomicrobiota bacterium]
MARDFSPRESRRPRVAFFGTSHRFGGWDFLRWLVMAVILFEALVLGGRAFGQDTNTLQIIQQLQKRIDELEQKVKRLEADKEGRETEQSRAREAAAQAQQKAAELDNKLQALEKARAQDAEAAEAKSKEAQRAQERVSELDKKLQGLEQQREHDAKVAEAKATNAPVITVGEKGFSVRSANGDFGLQVGAVLQVDSRTFLDEPGVTGNDAFLLRRVRPTLQGTLFRDFDFLVMPDFGPSTPVLYDMWLNYKYKPELQLMAGKFKSPVGLEQLQADRDLTFNERTLVTALVPNRDIGFMLHGDLFKEAISYSAGIFDGVGDGRNNTLNAATQNYKAYEGRLFFQPFKPFSEPGPTPEPASAVLTALRGFGFGLGGSYQRLQGTNTTDLPQTTGGSLPGFTTDGQQQFFAYNPTNKATVLATGEHWRLSPQAYYYWGPFSLFGEYVISDQQVTRTGAGVQPNVRLANTAWEITAGWVLTGEEASWRGRVVPRHNFNPFQGGWGAWEVVGRYSELHVDDAAFPNFADPATSAHAANEWAVGLNWYLNRNVWLKGSYSHGWFEGGGGKGTSAPATITRQDENVIFTRLQFAF